VDETFADHAAFQAHQARTAKSEWGLKTAHIAREYKIRDRADPKGAAPSTDKSPI
jgi:quinol monooxygenase YgiN